MVHSGRRLTENGSTQWSSPAKSPRFFKIINSSAVLHQKLKIPRKFVRKYGKDLGSLVLLKVPRGASWEVELVKSNKETYLCKGWEEFTKYYSIRLWYFLVFGYEGKSSFNVIIFDMSGSEIEYPFNPIPTHDKQINKNLCTAMIQHVPKRGGTRMVKMSENKGSSALEMARTFKSRNPFFIVTMHKSYVSQKCGLNVPLEFAKKHIRTKHDKVELQVSDGRVWSTKFNWFTEHSKCFLDCVSFARDNSIKVGDVCVFELIDPVKPLMNVVTFRKLEF